MKLESKIVFSFILILLFPIILYAHQGRTDGYGGHYDRSKGTYHYHSGIHAGTGEYTAPLEEGGELINPDAYYTNTNGRVSSSSLISNNITDSNKSTTRALILSTKENEKLTLLQKIKDFGILGIISSFFGFMYILAFFSYIIEIIINSIKRIIDKIKK